MSRITTMRKESRKKARRANKKVAPVASDARDGAVHYAGATRDWAAPKAEAAKEWAAPKAEAAVDWAAPKAGAAKDWAAPKVEPAVAKVKSDVLPKVAGAVTAALVASEPAREEAKSRGTAAFAALKGEVAPPKPRRRKRKLLLLLTVIGGAYAGWKAWAKSASERPEPWATPVSTMPSTGNVGLTGTYGSSASDDVAGASPDEALADESDLAAAAESAPAETETVSPKQSRKVKDETETGH